MYSPQAFAATIGVILLTATAYPVCYGLNLSSQMDVPFYVFLVGVGVAFVAFPALTYVLIIRNIPVRKDKSGKSISIDWFFYVFAVFGFTAVVDLLIALTLDEFTDCVEFYLHNGERYLQSPYGAIINYYDGTVHYSLYILMCFLILQGKSFRYWGLFWVGSIMNSIIVFLPGNVIGSWAEEVLPSYFLNIPYAFLPIYFAWREVVTVGRQPVAKRPSREEGLAALFSRPLDLALVVYAGAAVVFCFVRFLATMGNPRLPLIDFYMKTYEPYLLDPSQWPRLQMLVGVYYMVPSLLALARALIYPSVSTYAPDIAALLGGAALQMTVAHVVSALHPLPRYPTPNYTPIPENAIPTFLALNGAFLVGALVLFYRCCLSSNAQSFVAVSKEKQQ